jgi:hypothetical protein
MTTASLRTASGSILGAVTESFNAIGSVFTAASGGASMLNTYVNDARQKQSDRSIIEMHSYRNRLIEETAEENSKRRKRISLLLNEDKEFKQIFETELEILNGLFEKKSSNSED